MSTHTFTFVSASLVLVALDRVTSVSAALLDTRIYFEGPNSSVKFMVDDASVTEVGGTQPWRNTTDHVIDQRRKSNINIR